MLSQESREWLLCSVTIVVILALSGISLWLVISGLTIDEWWTSNKDTRERGNER